MNKRVTVVCVLVLFLQAYPVGIFAERSRVETENIVAAATADAQADAHRDIDRHIWVACGCLLPIIGIGIAYHMTTPPKEEYLLGKSPAYVDIYIEVYKKEAHKIRVQSALIGCLTASILGVLAYGCYQEYQETKEEDCIELDWTWY